MANRQDYARLLNLMLGNGGPNPYMGLDLRGRLQNGWDNFAQRYLPQAPGMQRELFPQYDENDPYAYEIMKKVYNIQ